MMKQEIRSKRLLAEGSIRITIIMITAIADLFTDIYKDGLVRPDDCQEFLQVLNRCKKKSKYSSILGKCELESTYNRFACEIVTVIVRTIFTAITGIKM